MRARFTKGLSAVLVLNMLLCTNTYASTGPGDYYDSYSKNTRYKVGSTLDAGKYVLFNTSDSKNASLSVKRDGETVLSDTYWYNYIVELESDDVLNLVNGYLVEYEEAEDDIVSSEDGFFEVGKQIDAGTYSVEFVRSSDDTASYTVWSNLSYSGSDTYKTGNISRGGSASVTLQEGQYVQLSGCRLIYEKTGGKS